MKSYRFSMAYKVKRFRDKFLNNNKSSLETIVNKQLKNML